MSRQQHSYLDGHIAGGNPSLNQLNQFVQRPRCVWRILAGLGLGPRFARKRVLGLLLYDRSGCSNGNWFRCNLRRSGFNARFGIGFGSGSHIGRDWRNDRW